MRRTAQAVLLSTILASCSAPPAGLSDVWRLQSDLGHSSCFPIAFEDGILTLVTAKHCAHQPDTWASLGTLTTGLVTFVWESEDSDVAVLQAPLLTDLPVRLFSIRRSPPTFGEAITVSGYASEPDRLTVTDGRVSGPRDMSAPLWPGSSGSPVLDGRGLVVGVASSTAMDSAPVIGFPVSVRVRVPHVSYFAPAQEVLSRPASRPAR